MRGASIAGNGRPFPLQYLNFETREGRRAIRRQGGAGSFGG